MPKITAPEYAPNGSDYDRTTTRILRNWYQQNPSMPAKIRATAKSGYDESTTSKAILATYKIHDPCEVYEAVHAATDAEREGPNWEELAYELVGSRLG